MRPEPIRTHHERPPATTLDRERVDLARFRALREIVDREEAAADGARARAEDARIAVSNANRTLGAFREQMRRSPTRDQRTLNEEQRLVDATDAARAEADRLRERVGIATGRAAAARRLYDSARASLRASGFREEDLR